MRRKKDTMTAKKMFKDLGFECVEFETQFGDYIIEYHTTHPYFNDFVKFSLKHEEIYINDQTEEPINIGYELFRAIAKQVEELRWGEEE